ncbi:hypothetical protein [Paraflavitalea sp. CAU 1676]|uniref:hypothetical protein n=1 Tax=Paraflavitalea sp. CAU 1676 TaxID=3032598 RepID=UPI0023DA625D|nr:hypothetical protein [Paraflavitalea sp. CAU 1676]MDF2189935.1 hypothetical protein [Paraflavitalea sp. CAU 1676]
MKKLQYNYLPADGGSTGKATKGKTNAKSTAKQTAPVPPDEETVNRLNAIAREYPFCVYFKQSTISLL